MGGVAWTEEEDRSLKKCIDQYGEGKWHLVPLLAGLNRCRKSCRLRWLNYLRPNIKRGSFSEEEMQLIIKLHNHLGNRWSVIAKSLPGRTANDVKNYWNCHLAKKLNINYISDQQISTTEDHHEILIRGSTKPRNIMIPDHHVAQPITLIDQESSSSSNMSMPPFYDQPDAAAAAAAAAGIVKELEEESSSVGGIFVGDLGTEDHFDEGSCSNLEYWDDFILEDMDLWTDFL